jgi:glycosyltransferase involved in cell wall biosynthesis
MTLSNPDLPDAGPEAVAAAGPAPAVTVLMTVYNAGRYLAGSVESILSQTFRDFEFLIIDDGSTDDSAAILRRFAAADARVRLVSRPNTGIVGALNEGLGLARAGLIARMDADDLAMPERLERQVAYLRAHQECVAVGSRVLAVDPAGDPLCDWTCEESHEEIESLLLDEGRGAGIIHPAVMFRRDAAAGVGNYRDRAAEDKDLFLRLAEVGRLANLPEVLLHYRQHQDSLCHGAHNDWLPRSIRLTLEEAYRRRGLDPSRVPIPGPRTRLTAPDRHLAWGWLALGSGYAPTARKHALSRLRMAPLSSASWRLLYCTLRGR